MHLITYKQGQPQSVLAEVRESQADRSVVLMSMFDSSV